MGKILNTSQPTVINTDLSPLTDTFYISANGDLDQWYYENTGDYAPNRQTTPLVISPHITAADAEAGVSYTPSFYSCSWYVKQYTSSGWEETQITSTSTSSTFYIVTSTNSLVVRKNNPDAGHGITVICRAEYIDPRDSGRTYKVEDSLVLGTSIDASPSYPTIQIANPKSRTYNPLVSASSQFTFNAVANWDNVPNGSTHAATAQFVWYAIINNTEQLIQSFPFYVSGQYTNTLVVDAMYANNLNVVLRIKETSSSANPMPMKEYASIAWKAQPVDAFIVSDNGNVVRNTSSKFKFRMIVNVNDKTLTDTEIANNLRFNWKLRDVTSVKEGAVSIPHDNTYDRGWGSEIVLPASDLVKATSSQNGSKLVYNEVFLLGAYEILYQDNVAITDDYSGEYVYGRVM